MKKNTTSVLKSKMLVACEHIKQRDMQKSLDFAESVVIRHTNLNHQQVNDIKLFVLQGWNNKSNYKDKGLALINKYINNPKEIPLKEIGKFASMPIEYWQGIFFYQAKSWSIAEECFRKSLDKRPDCAFSNFKLGMSLFKQKKWDLAYEYILKAVQLNPTMDNWKIQLMQSKLRNLSQLDSLGSSVVIEESLLREKIEYKIDVFNSYVALAKNLKKQGKYWQEIEALNEAIKLRNGNPDLYIELGEACLQMKRYESAVSAYLSALDIDGVHRDAYLYYKIGYSAEKANMQPDYFKKYYNLAILNDKVLGSRLLGIGAFHEKLGLWYDAAESYLRLLKKKKVDPELSEKLAFAYLRCYEWKKAKFYYKKTIDDLSVINPECFYRLGFIEERLNNFEQAVYWYKKATEYKYVSYWYYRLGVTLSKNKQYQQAAWALLSSKKNFDLEMFLIRDVKTVAELGLFQHPLLLSLYENLGNLPLIESFYSQLVARSNDYNSDYYYALGYILFQLGEYKKASKVLENIRLLREPYGLSTAKFDNNADFREVSLYMEYFKNLEIKRNTVLFESFGGTSMTCNPFAIFLEMLSRPQFSDFTYIWVVDDVKNILDKFKNQQNIIFVKKNSDLYLRYLCSAAYLINNATFPPYFIRKEDQFYLNTWHGTPWKTLGKDIKNGFMELKNTQRNFLQASHLISPNPHTSWVLSERYDISDIYTGKFLECGYPRIDLTLNADDAKKQNLRELLNIDNSRATVLYAPTWRGTLGAPEVESAKLINEIKLLSKLDINILFRGHYFVENNAYDMGMGQYIVPALVNTNELLSIVDVLITDYSSVAFDYMVTGKPIIYYIYDYLEYEDSRGLYFEPKEMPGLLAYSIEDLINSLNCILNDCKKFEKSRVNEFILHEDGGVSKKVVDWFFNQKHNDAEVSLYDNNKKSLLFYGGELTPNGITTSLINLLTNIDRSKYVISLLIDPNSIASDEKRLQQFYQLPNDVKIIPRVGRMNRTIENDWIEAKINQYKFLPTEMRECFEDDYVYEFQRIVGCAHFDVVIEFTGYSRFWAYVLGSKKDSIKTIYQHNDMYGEWKMRFPRLENTFSAYYMFDNIISVSKPTMELNIKNLAELFEININKFGYCDNVQNPQSIIDKSNIPINDEDKIYFEGEGKVFVNLARLSPEKNQAKLIRAFEKLIAIYPNSKLLILGDGPLKNNLIKLITDAKLHNNVFLLGIRFNPFPILKKADCFVLSSDHEGQPMTLFEAMILEKPIISTDIAGSRSALEGRPGYLVENTEDGLYKGMKEFIEGKLSFDKFDYEAYQQQSLDMFYQKALIKV